MRRKMRSRWGFTLMEVLVVVALIVILIAISIPAVMGVLNNARHKTDAKYERAAKALATGGYSTGAYSQSQYVFDAENGKLVLCDENISGFFSKCTPYGQCRTHKHEGLYLLVQIKDAGNVEVKWAKGFSGTGIKEPADKLCGDLD